MTYQATAQQKVLDQGDALTWLGELFLNACGEQGLFAVLLARLPLLGNWQL
jgi:hypothetical protein